MSVDRKRNFIINTVYIALIGVLVFFVLKYCTVWLLPFVIGFACAMVLQKPVTFLSRKTKIPRAIWALVLVVVLLSVLAGLIGSAGYLLYDQLLALGKNLIDQIPAVQEDLSQLVGRFSGWLNNLPQGIADTIRSSPGEIAGTAVTFLSELLTSIASGVIINVPSLLLTTVISVVACCFITIDYYKITNFILCQFSLRTQKVLLKSKRVFTENILKMLRGYLIVMGITFVELFIGFLILGIPYTATIALLVAIVDIFPILGTGTVLIPWGIVALVLGNTGTGIGVLVLYVAITVIRNLVEPKIIGDQVGLPPIVTLIAMYVGLRVFGFWGLWGLPILLIVVSKLQETGMIRIWKNGSRPAQSVAEEKQEQE